MVVKTAKAITTHVSSDKNLVYANSNLHKVF